MILYLRIQKLRIVASNVWVTIVFNVSIIIKIYYLF